MLNKISTAFLQLLATEPQETITVREITKTAKIPRTSFYNLYDSKNNLANALLMQEMQRVFDYVTRKFTNRREDNRITEEGLKDLLIHREIITKLWKINTEKLDLMTKLEIEVSKSAQIAIHKQYKHASEDDITFFCKLFASCFVKTMEWYYSENSQITTKELAQRINTCIYDGMIHLVDA